MCVCVGGWGGGVGGTGPLRPQLCAGVMIGGDCFIFSKTIMNKYVSKERVALA